MDHQIEEVELSNQTAKKMIELGNALQRLEKNRDFKRLFVEGYLREEAIRLVHIRGDHNMQDEVSQKIITQLMDGITGLTHYCNRVRHEAHLAEKAVEENDRLLEELRAGEDD